ncbi:MAG: TonB-dependent receptor [Helicobacteraceae bacterium]|nr:TonB-dependent receptor [Helicobacteraceae bacterium]
MSSQKSSTKIGLIVSAYLLFPSIALTQTDMTLDATAIPFEELLQKEYIPASKIANQISNSSSAVSIVTHEDIKRYGYKTLGEILGSMRGLHVFEDYEYMYLGGRAYGKPGDYAGRVILLIDGYKANDSFYGQAFFKEDGLLDISLIERVEYIPGGNSAGYATGALLGAVNIITKNGNDIGGTVVSYGRGSHDTKKRQVVFGEKFDNGFDMVLSYSDFDTKGRDHSYFDSGVEVQEKNNYEENYRVFLKTSYKNLSLEGALVDHKKNIPIYPNYLYVPPIPDNQQDQNSFIRLKYDSDLTQNTKISSSLWYGYYNYHYAMKEPDLYSGFYETDAKWYGGDIKVIGNWFENHTLSFGIEYRHDYRLKEYFYDNYLESNSINFDTVVHTPRKTSSYYLYDNYTVTPTLSINFGARYEKSDTGYGQTSPQASLVWNITKQRVLKLSTAITKRQKTPYENIGTKPEEAKKTELVIEESFRRKLKLLGSVYSYTLFDEIFNSSVKATGAELELEKYWQNTTHFRLSYAYQKAIIKELDTKFVNIPNHNAKINFATPLIDERLRLGVEWQYIGKKAYYNQKTIPSYSLTNINLLSHSWIPDTDISLKVKNLWDKKYGDITWERSNGDKLYPQDGRTFWFEIGYKF